MGNTIPTLKLTYFDIKGVAEKIRLALVLQGIEFEDDRISSAQWQDMKPKTKYGQLPMLTISGKETVYQSDAMLRFVARLKSTTLYPVDLRKQLQVEEVLGLCADMVKAWYPAFYMGMKPTNFGHAEGFEKTPEGQELVKKLRSEFVLEVLPKFLGWFSDYLSNHDFLAGNAITIADLSLFTTLVHYQSGVIDHVPTTCLDAYPKIVQWIARINALPRIAGWYAPKKEKKEEKKQAPKSVLMVLTSNDVLGETGEQTGWYLPEVAHPHQVFTEAGFKLTYASIKGGVAPLDIGSIEASPDESSQKFYKDEACMQLTKTTISIDEAKAADYDCIFYAGGFGTMWDFPESKGSARLAGEIYDKGGVVAAVCHGPSALINVKTQDGTLLVKGKKVTAFTNAEEDAAKKRDVVPWTCEDKLKELGAEFVDGGVFQESVQVSERLMTGQNPPSAEPLAKAIVKFLS